MDVVGPQGTAAGVFEQYGQQYRDGHVHAATLTL
jgi:hypothetical protein